MGRILIPDLGIHLELSVFHPLMLNAHFHMKGCVPGNKETGSLDAPPSLQTLCHSSPCTPPLTLHLLSYLCDLDTSLYLSELLFLFHTCMAAFFQHSMKYLLHLPHLMLQISKCCLRGVMWRQRGRLHLRTPASKSCPTPLP